MRPARPRLPRRAKGQDGHQRHCGLVHRHASLAKYSALLLPNTALLSDEQCQQLRDYVGAGGSLLATFETSMYTERNEPRSDFGLADVFGIRKTGSIIGTAGNAYLARIEKQHE